MRPTELEGRSLGALLAVIRTHIQTGEPVGSRTISRQWNDELSPATIRNIMLELEEEGYLDQPHTSAGRVPTEKAYKFYASQVDGHQPPSKADEALLRSYLSDIENMPREVLQERISRVLSLISNNLGVVVSEPISRAVLEHIHFARIGNRRVLVVLVSGVSLVRDRVIRLEKDIPQQELDRLSNFLNENFHGWRVDDVRSELVKRLAEERVAFDSLQNDLEQLCSQGLFENSYQAEVFLEGASNLIGRPELADPSRIRELLKALEEKENLVRLINECIRSEDALQVIIGLPGKPPLLKTFALIGTIYRLEGRSAGRLAILGPTRMNYERVIRAVGYVGRLLQQQDLN
ncbi:MAG: heat-inducible transcription repressor HrcA [Acidobacteria bacterium]|nr:heat-inducible transcription repressor HrcA [Acidobacteriota bacterium]